MSTPEQNRDSRDIREDRAAQLSHLFLELDPEVQASLEAILGNDQKRIDAYLFGINASGGDASNRPPAI